MAVTNRVATRFKDLVNEYSEVCGELLGSNILACLLIVVAKL